MVQAKVTEAEFIELWKTHKGSAAAVAKVTGTSHRQIHYRRRGIEARTGLPLISEAPAAKHYENRAPSPTAHKRINLGIENGCVLVFSDAHFWPGIRTTAFKALLWAIQEFKPAAIICNGDALDGAAISRHDPLGWEKTPSVIQELKATQAALGEIEEAAKAARHNVKLIYTWGNHDQRFAMRLASNAPQFANVHGFRLEDHITEWEFGMSCWPTDDVVVKHRYKGGIHATHNNAVGSGKSIVTGHLHSLKVTPFADYNGNRFGVDTGTLAEPYGPQFAYGEDNPLNHRSGFAVLTIFNGRLLWPELVHKINEGDVEFRGEVIDVSAM